MSIELLIGRTLAKIDKSDEEIIFICDNGDRFKMYHDQDCCESVTVEDVVGTLDNLIGTPILTASETSNSEELDYESSTWTFYNIATVKGSVTIRWLGQSNGYYSERVDFEQISNINDN